MKLYAYLGLLAGAAIADLAGATHAGLAGLLAFAMGLAAFCLHARLWPETVAMPLVASLLTALGLVCFFGMLGLILDQMFDTTLLDLFGRFALGMGLGVIARNTLEPYSWAEEDAVL